MSPNPEPTDLSSRVLDMTRRLREWHDTPVPYRGDLESHEWYEATYEALQADKAQLIKDLEKEFI